MSEDSVSNVTCIVEVEGNKDMDIFYIYLKAICQNGEEFHKNGMKFKVTKEMLEHSLPRIAEEGKIPLAILPFDFLSTLRIVSET